MKMVKPAEVSR